MATVPDSFELVVKGKRITCTTTALLDQILFRNINLDSEQAAALARLINLNDGEQDLRVEIKVA